MIRLKFLSDDSKNKIYHGDVLIKKSVIPNKAEEGAAPDVLGWGEIAGAAHRITQGEVKFYKFDAKKYFKAITDVVISHDAEGHLPVVIPAGDYEYGNAQEFNYESMEAKRVVD